MMLKDRNGKVIGKGAVARPVVGYKTNKEGLIIKIDEVVGNITLEFEDDEIGIYHNDKIIMC
ncbi:hypothetical protein [Paenibacillus sp. FSL H3-0333]|uniref:hypothetical protein n=1 Tax=Paenibacillus sp. FSL H3-0333 TaxID=2921373 RepID=UPI0030F86D08